jgi:ABC-2 type transport system permease protein
MYSSFKAVFRREAKRIAERKTLYLLSIVAPVLLFPFFAYIYSSGVLRNIAVVICDGDNSDVSRMIIRSIESTSAFRIVDYAQSTDEIRDKFRKGEVQAAFYIPKNLERDLKEGKPSTVVVFNNVTNLVIANTVLKEASTVIKTISGGILLKKLRSNGMQLEQAMNVINPIRIQSQALYNPNYNYMSYLSLGIIPVIFQMLIMVGGVLLISSEFTHNTFGELAAAAGNNAWVILLGKSLPHLGIHLASALGILGIVFPLFGIYGTGSILVTFLLFVLLVMASLFPAIMISAMFHDQQFATEVALFFNVPAFIFSGYLFPLWAMPVFHQWFARTIPYTHFLYGFLKVFRADAPLSAALPEILWLCGFVVVSIGITVLLIRREICKLSLGAGLEWSDAS